MASKKNNVQTLSAETDAKYAAGKAVEEIVRRIVRAEDTDSIDKVLVITNGCLRLADISLFKVEYTLKVITTPSNATVTLNGVESDTVTVLAGSSVLVEVTADGYLPYSETIIMNSDKELGVSLVQDYITVTPSSFALGNQTSSGHGISVSTPGTWTAQAPSWITLSSTSGGGDSQITFSVEENPDTISRTGTIIFTSQTGITASVSVEQEAKEEETLSVSPASAYLDYGGGTLTLTITSNTTWKITSDGDISLGFSRTEGEGDGAVTVTYPQNPDPTSMPTATVTVETGSGKLSGEVTLTQYAATPEVTVTPEVLEGTLGQNFTFNVKVNGYTSELFIYVSRWQSTSYGGVTYVNLQGATEHSITADGAYAVTPGDSFSMVVSTAAADTGSSYPAEIGITLSPYNGATAGETVRCEIDITSAQ